MQKYLVKYKGKSIAVGNTFSEAIAEAFEVIVKNNKKNIWA